MTLYELRKGFEIFSHYTETLPKKISGGAGEKELYPTAYIARRTKTGEIYCECTHAVFLFFVVCREQVVEYIIR